MSVSVLIPTLNEERNISECLASVAWSDDVVVVDSNSVDRTGGIARAAGARVVEFKWDGNLPKKKNWALANVDWRHPWVLVLDADERVTPELAEELLARVANTDCRGFLLNRRLIFLGRWIKHCGYYPSWNVRLFLHRRGRFESLVDGDTGSGDNEVHEHVIVDGLVGRLRGELVHHAYPDIATWVEKHNRYSNWEAAVEVWGVQSGRLPSGTAAAARRHARILTRKLPCRPTLRFLYSYVLHGGFLDGYPGYVLSRLMATYELLSLLKAREARQRRTTP
ncbi:MAG: glycosyltransferase family 2 protein [Acidobacteria bacterium]|nr:MAG: glycosyltransferase family 2 protein [Acidobacteriota bacterium]